MVSVVADAKGKIVDEIQNHGGSNSLAELIAVEHAIDYALAKRQKRVHIISDSMTAISQFNKDESARNPKTLRKMNDPEWYQAIKGRIDDLKRFIDVKIEWQSRENNLAGHYIEEKYGL